MPGCIPGYIIGYCIIPGIGAIPPIIIGYPIWKAWDELEEVVVVVVEDDCCIIIF